jgi:hypothetical protein
MKSGLPEWIADEKTWKEVTESEKCDGCLKLIKALAIAVEALKEVALPPYKDSDYKSLLDTLRVRAKDALQRIEKIGEDK